MSNIKTIKHLVNEKVGEDDEGKAVLKRVRRVEYEFSDDVSAEAKKEIKEYYPPLTDKDKINEIIDSVDE